ncbi:type II toxin-antitoxin system prevent-host-death family antitoxin [Gemmatimonadota bacterium Y43]|uniref:type II toxin-antitoxin system Phd/YefM family antitoxin n=1 Tax=Gaopeijia maritima TaxID=3119007 RepID=UPI00326A145D
MHSVGAYEAKTHLSALLRRVEKGERITITRHGVPIAELVPSGAVGTVDAAAAVAELRDFAKGRTLGPGISVRDLIDEGRHTP